MLLIFLCTQDAAPIYAERTERSQTTGWALPEGGKPSRRGGFARDNRARLLREPVLNVTGPPNATREPYRTVVRPDSATVLTYDGATLEFPIGAVRKSVEVTIEPLLSVAFLDPGMENVTSPTAGFRLLPLGMKFEKPVILRVPYERGTFLGTELSSLYTYYYDEGHEGWRRLERLEVDRQAGVVVSLTDHFTDFINSVLTLPQSPNPLQFNPTSVKNITAADPGAGIPVPDRLEATAFGAAQFSIPLDLPPGRLGVAPRLALSYNSERSSGSVGRGFDIAIPFIGIDTRFHLPTYDGNDDYTFAGQDLVKVAESGDTAVFRPRQESVQDLIVRHGSGAAEYWWEVIDIGGGRSIFGNDGRFPDAVNPLVGNIYRWHLSHERDPNGNSVDYRYDNEENCTYISSIRYTGTETGGPGPFLIKFIYTRDRPDNRYDARGKFLSHLTKRLSQIEITYDERPTPVRSYSFDYGVNLFGQSELSQFSQKDGAGNVFWTYAFDYYALDPVDDGQGYLAFSGERDWGGSVNEYLYQDRTASVGANLYAGVEVWIPWFKFWGFTTKELLSFGVKGGLGESVGITNNTLMDLNGDGLPDLVRKDGSLLTTYYNRGCSGDNSFTPGPAWDGVTGLLDREYQSSFHIGVSARLGVAAGELTLQNSFCQAQSIFADLNGDGFIDYLKTGDASYALNNAINGQDRFVSQSLSFDGEASGGTDSSETENFNRAYFQQEPLRRWSACRSGTVEVAQEARLDADASEDGVTLRTYQGDTAVQEFFLMPGGTVADSASSKEYSVQRGKALYFHEDTGRDERGDLVDWKVKIRYTTVKLFEDMGESSVAFDPPPGSLGGLPWGDVGLDPIYDRYRSSGDVMVFTLKTDWAASANEEVYTTLLRRGAFVPSSIPQVLFQKMYELGTSENIIVTRSAAADPEQVPKSLFLDAGYFYRPETGQFVPLADAELPARMTNKSGQLNDDLLGLVRAKRAPVAKDLLRALTSEERVELGTYCRIDGSPMQPRPIGDGAFGVTVGSSLRSQPEIGEPAALGTELADKGLLLDRRNDPSTGQSTRVWLRQGSIVREANDTEQVMQNAELLVSGDDPLAVSYLEDGVHRSVVLRGKSRLLTSLTSAIYEGPVSDAVLKNESFSSDGYRVMPGAVWSTIRNGIINQFEKDLLSAAYETIGTTYQLRVDIAVDDFHRVLRILDESTAQPGIALALMPGGSKRENRIIRFSATEYEQFLTVGQGLSALFGSYMDGATTWYYPLPNLDLSEQSTLSAAMRIFRRDRELFPDYTPSSDGQRWNLKSNCDESRVRMILSAAGISVWTSVERSIHYRSTDSYSVSRSASPETENEFPKPPSGGAPRSQTSAGRIDLPSFDGSGQTVYRPVFIHDFDSGADYSAVDLDRVPDGPLYEETLPVDPDPFSGGVYGWYYGFWSGYYDQWSEARLTADASSGHDNGGRQAAPPPYFVGAERNYDTGTGEPRITCMGPEAAGIPVESNAWIGQVSRNRKMVIGEDGNFSTTEHTFAPMIHGDRLTPARNGGDAFYNIPQDSAQGRGGTLSAIRTSKTKAQDINGGLSLGPLGTNLGRNSSRSWQYQALFDLNGDHYPDLVQFQEDGDHNDFIVLPGTGIGFDSPQSFHGSNSSAACYENVTYGFGASTGVSVGSQTLTVRSDARPIASTVNGAQSDGASFGANGTGGASVQQQGFVDINGDGLPDEVSRRGNEDYSVFLNLGTGQFDVGLQGWRGGLAMQIPEVLPGQSTAPKGITHSAVGSFGGSVGLSINGGVTGFGVSVGFTGTVNQTYSELVDVNGDSLPDQVGKKEGESFFRVRFNQGDCFGDEVNLYRPAWEINRSTVLKQAIILDLNNLSVSGFGTPMGTRLPGTGQMPDENLNLFATSSIRSVSMTCLNT